MDTCRATAEHHQLIVNDFKIDIVITTRTADGFNDYFGIHRYGVRFPDKEVYKEEDCTIGEPIDQPEENNHITIVKDLDQPEQNEEKKTATEMMVNDMQEEEYYRIKHTPKEPEWIEESIDQPEPPKNILSNITIDELEELDKNNKGKIIRMQKEEKGEEGLRWRSRKVTRSR